MMRTIRLTIIFACSAFVLASCGGGEKPLEPVDTLKKYTEAVQRKDLTQMKLLLSDATLKLHADQAKAQKVTLDEIVQRETFFPPDQRVFAFRNQIIEGVKATVEVKNNFGGWDKIYLVREGGSWKIDKKGTAQEMIKQSDADVISLDEQMDAERKKTEELMNQQDAADPNATPTADPATAPTPGEKGLLDPAADRPGSPPSTMRTPN